MCAIITCNKLLEQALCCIQNVYKMFLYKTYPTFQQTFVHILHTKLSCHSSFNFVYKMRSLSECGIHFVYILYTSVVYISYNFCIQNVYTVSVRVIKINWIHHSCHYYVQRSGVWMFQYGVIERYDLLQGHTESFVGHHFLKWSFFLADTMWENFSFLKSHIF